MLKEAGGGDIVHDAGDVDTLSETIQLFVVFGPDEISSSRFRVTVRSSWRRSVVGATPSTEVEE